MTPAKELPVWRSLLFVPVTVEKFVATAHTRGADGYILDLEDAVAASEKDRARTLVQDAAKRVGVGGADIAVRINRPWRMALRDIEASVSPSIKALLLPKTESADHVKMIAEVVSELEAERGMPHGHTWLIPMVETAAAFFNMHEIPRADPRVVALNLGSEDFALAIGTLPVAEALFFPMQQMIIAARAAGVVPMGFMGTVADYKDLVAFRETIRRSRGFGFQGSACIHPGQVAILNEEYGVRADEVAAARRMVAAYDAALAAGKGAVEFEGKMIDVPVVERAQNVIRRADALAKLTRAG